MRRALSTLIYALSMLIGIAAFAYPFFLPQLPVAQGDAAYLAEAPLLTTVLLALCLIALLVEMQGEVVSAKMVAALGVLVALASVLRFVETAIPGPGGFSPIFAPIILAGYVFGVRFGFLMGALTLLVSALLTGGLGPWLPYQMFVAAWVGLTAGWLPRLPHRPRLELAMLASFSFGWGFLFGLITNLYFWPFFVGESGMAWQPGAGIPTAISHYLAFYATTSLLWDIVRAVGNGALILVLGRPAIRALARFRDRFHFTVVTEEAYAEG
jgi:energy-coupling factor transport system substrate-specific component